MARQDRRDSGGFRGRVIRIETGQGGGRGDVDSTGPVALVSASREELRGAPLRVIIFQCGCTHQEALGDFCVGGII